MAHPTTLAAALTQLEHLSARLTLASSLFHQHTNKDLAPLLDASLPQTAYLSAPPARPAPTSPSPPPAPAFAATTASTTGPKDVASREAAEPEEEAGKDAFDISPLVLKALAIRKAVHVGELEDGEGAVAELVAGLPVTDEQKEQLRTWAGLP